MGAENPTDPPLTDEERTRLERIRTAVPGGDLIANELDAIWQCLYRLHVDVEYIIGDPDW